MDSAREPVGAEMRGCAAEAGVELRCTTPSHPAASGFMERAQRVLKLTLPHLVKGCPGRWLNKLSLCEVYRIMNQGKV